jgi:phage major head subunit gpT-like protein
MFGPTIAQRAAIENARVSLHAFFLEALDGIPADPLEQLAQEVPSSTAIEEYDWIGDIPGLTEWIGDRAEATIMAGSFRIANKDWASGIQIHRNEILDHKMAQIGNRVRALAQEAQYHYADLLAQVLLNGFDGTAFPDIGDGICYDGSFLFANDHSSEDGPAQTNLLGGAFSESTLETGIKNFSKLRNHTGKRPIRVRPTHILCGPDVEPAVDRVLTRDFVPDPDGGDHSVSNTYKGRLTKMVSPWIRDYTDVGGQDLSACWFLLDLSKPLKPLILQKREPITSTALIDWNSEEMYRRGKQRFGCQSRDNAGYGAWQCAAGYKP